MSALPPLATEKADIRTRSCPLYPQKRTSAAQDAMSAKGHKRTYAVHRPMSALLPKGTKAVAWLRGLSLLQAENVVDDVVGIRTGHYKIWHSTFVA